MWRSHFGPVRLPQVQDVGAKGFRVLGFLRFGMRLEWSLSAFSLGQVVLEFLTLFGVYIDPLSDFSRYGTPTIRTPKRTRI